MPDILDSPTLAKEFVDDQEKRHKDPNAFKGYRFPVPWFMDLTGGWGRGWLCYVMGQGGNGKTSVISTAATQLGKDKVRFLYISLEEDLGTVTQRIFTNLENIDRTRFRDVTLRQSDWPNVYAAANTLSKFDAYWTADAFTEQEIIQAVADTDPDVIFLDYLQLMHTDGQSMTEKVSNASKILYGLKKGRYKINGKKKPRTVIAACQLNDDMLPLGSRDPIRDGDLNITISNIDNGAGGILPDRKNFTVTKARNGGVGHTQIGFFGGRSMVGQLMKNTANQGSIPKP